MPRGKKKLRLGDLQLRIMRVLWDRDSCAVGEVSSALGGAELAYTTVATMLRKMEERGLVRHRSAGRRFIYEAVVEEADVTRSMSDDLVERLFAGSLADAVSHLLEGREVSAEELERLEQLIRRRKRKP